MACIIYLPTPPVIECTSGDITKSLSEYFRVLGTIPSQIGQQARLIDDQACREGLLGAVLTLKKTIDEITGILFTDVFQRLQDTGREMELKVREFIRDIEIFFQKMIIESSADLLSFLGIPTILDMEIPFLCEYTEIAADGTITKYKPLYKDIFTKEGKMKIKASAIECLDHLEDFFEDVKDFFTGELNFKSLDEQIEKIWARIQIKVNELFNNFIIALINTIYEKVKSIPGLGSLLAFVDSTESLTATYEKFKKEFIETYEEIKKQLLDPELDSKIKDALKKKAKELMDAFINTILDIGLPAPFNITIRDIMGIEDFETEWKKFKVIIKERYLERIEEGFRRLIESIRKYLAGNWINTLYELLLKLGGGILEQFPIIGKIIKWVGDIVGVLTGQYPWCDVIKILAMPIFSLADMMYSAVASVAGVQIEFTEFGYLPGSGELNT